MEWKADNGSGLDYEDGPSQLEAEVAFLKRMDGSRLGWRNTRILRSYPAPDDSAYKTRTVGEGYLPSDVDRQHMLDAGRPGL